MSQSARCSGAERGSGLVTDCESRDGTRQSELRQAKITEPRGPDKVQDSKDEGGGLGSLRVRVRESGREKERIIRVLRTQPGAVRSFSAPEPEGVPCALCIRNLPKTIICTYIPEDAQQPRWGFLFFLSFHSCVEWKRGEDSGVGRTSQVLLHFAFRQLRLRRVASCHERGGTERGTREGTGD